jgi:peptide/nickel transport system ATP-binding protein
MTAQSTELQYETLQVRDLSIVYKTIYGELKAVNKLNLTLGRGESVAVVGESGSGKSTLGLSIVKLLPGNARYSEGSITLNGQKVEKLKEHDLTQMRGSSVFMIFQDPLNTLNPVKKIKDQMFEALNTRNSREGGSLDKESGLKELIESLRSVRMPDPELIINRYPHQLSGGQIQRVVIAMGLLMRPKLLIADEPTSALDVTIQAQVLKLMRDLQKEYGMSILFVTHDISIAYAVSDRIIVMYAGEIVEDGPTEKVIRKSLHPYSQALIASIPKKTKDQGDLTTISGSPPNMLNPPSGCRFHPRCPFVMEKCLIASPNFVENDDRRVRCFLYGG